MERVDDLSDLALVCRVRVRVDERHGERLDTRVDEVANDLLDLLPVDRLDDLALRAHPLVRLARVLQRGRWVGLDHDDPAGDRADRAVAVDLPRKLPTEPALEPSRDTGQRVEVDARLDARAVARVDEILGADLPARPGSEGAAADASDRRVEHARARLERGVR